MAPIQPPTPQPQPTLFHTERIATYVSLPAASLTSALPSISANVFSPLLLTYYPPVRGVVLAYSDVELSSDPPATTSSTSSSKKRRHNNDAGAVTAAGKKGKTGRGETVLLRQIDEYTSPFLWASASLLIWRPSTSPSTPSSSSQSAGSATTTTLPATLTHQSSTHMTLSYLNLFAVTVLRAHMPAAWTWHEESSGRKKKGWDGRIEDQGGWWVDGEGERVGKEGEVMEVRVREWEARPGMGKGRGFVKVEGSFLEG